MNCCYNFVLNVATKASSLFVKSATWVGNEPKTVIFTVVVIASAVAIHHFTKKKRLREKWNSVGENVVVLHSLSRARTCPNLSPFVIKLETYFRMSGIKYELCSDQIIGPKGKTPWITLNGEDLADSQLIMEFLGKKFNLDFGSHLSNQERAIARAVTVMAEEHTFWGLVWWRFATYPDRRIYNLTHFPVNKTLAKYADKNVLRAQGLGVHSDEEVVEFIRRDLEVLSIFLGNKPFLTGDKPCEFDCSVFGQLSQFVWAAPGSPFAAMMQSDFRNLLHFCLRMKEMFWPDWDKCLID